MALNFNKARLLGYNHSSEFFGGSVLRYKTTKNISIEGLIINLTNSSGVSGILSGVEALSTNTEDWQDIIVVNNYNFGSGIIDSISFSPGLDVRTKQYNATIRIFSTGDFESVQQDSYQGIDYTKFRYIESLDETIEYDSEKDQDVYRHSISVKLLSDNLGSSISGAKDIAASLFGALNFTGFLGDYSGLSPYKSYFTESYDELTADCSFSQEYRLSTGTGLYRTIKSHSYNRGTDGNTLVSENGQIFALQEPYIDLLSLGYNNEIQYAYNNCLDVYNAYKDSNEYSLNEQFLNKGVQTNKFEGILNYNITYTNSPTLLSGYFWEYTENYEQAEDNTVNISERGQIVGYLPINTVLTNNQKYQNALSGWSNVQQSVLPRISGVYNKYKKAEYSPEVKLLETEESHNPYHGVISYTDNYTNDLTYDPTGDIRKITTTVEEQFQIPLTNSFVIFNDKEIEQRTNSSEISRITWDVELQGKRKLPIETYLTAAKNQITLPRGDYISEASYDYTPLEGRFSLKVGFNKFY